MIGGIPLHATNRVPAASAAAFDPATLTLTGWWRADFASVPWVGTASAGASNGRELSAGNSPVPGTAVNTKIPASFDGANDYLVEGTNTLDEYLDGAAYTAVLLVKPSALDEAAGNIYDNQQLLCDNGGNWGIALSDQGAAGWHYDTGWKSTAWVPCTADAWSMVAVTYNGTNISISVNMGTPQTVAAGNVALGGVVLQLARNYSTVRTTEDVLEVMTAQSALSSTVLGNIKTYFNTRYALSL